MIACTPVGLAVGAGAVVATAAAEERGLDGAATDAVIRAGIVERYLSEDSGLLRHVGVTVFERRVLLTGVVADTSARARAVALARTPEDVADVIDEITVRPDGAALLDEARDALIANEIRTHLTFDGKVRAINYSVAVVNRTVYLMGVAASPAELRRVLDWCRSTDYVRRVVSHVLLRDDPRRLSPREPASSQGGSA